MIKNNDNVSNDSNVENEKKSAFEYEYDFGYMFSTREGLLAKDIAEGLNDTKNIRYYFSVALDHSERYLCDIYRKVRETPEHKIKKSRGALFTYLVRKYEKFDSDD
jgi:hypothetical protein